MLKWTAKWLKDNQSGIAVNIVSNLIWTALGFGVYGVVWLYRNSDTILATLSIQVIAPVAAVAGAAMSIINIIRDARRARTGTPKITEGHKTDKTVEPTDSDEMKYLMGLASVSPHRCANVLEGKDEGEFVLVNGVSLFIRSDRDYAIRYLDALHRAVDRGFFRKTGNEGEYKITLPGVEYARPLPEMFKAAPPRVVSQAHTSGPSAPAPASPAPAEPQTAWSELPEEMKYLIANISLTEQGYGFVAYATNSEPAFMIKDATFRVAGNPAISRKYIGAFNQAKTLGLLVQNGDFYYLSPPGRVVARSLPARYFDLPPEIMAARAALQQKSSYQGLVMEYKEPHVPGRSPYYEPQLGTAKDPKPQDRGILMYNRVQTLGYELGASKDGALEVVADGTAFRTIKIDGRERTNIAREQLMSEIDGLKEFGMVYTPRPNIYALKDWALAHWRKAVKDLGA